jgi:hypothetical protein
VILEKWEDLEKKEYHLPEFLLDPYIPRESIVLLWGDTSIGKSPITWAMAKAVGSGTHFFGLPCREGRVLYIEADTPEVVYVPRLRKTKAAPNVWFLFTKPLSVPGVTKEQYKLLSEVKDEVDPELIILSSLRKLHAMDDKDSKTPTAIYGFFQHLFPKSALLFIHHERKGSQDPRAVYHNKEGFSGSKHWIDDSQVGLHLSRYLVKKRSGRGIESNLKLFLRKSQATEEIKPLPLLLSGDGTNVSSPKYDLFLDVYTAMNEWEGQLKHLDAVLADKLNVGVRTIQRVRCSIERHEFPGSRLFLSRGTVGETEESEGEDES